MAGNKLVVVGGEGEGDCVGVCENTVEAVITVTMQMRETIMVIMKGNDILHLF